MSILPSETVVARRPQPRGHHRWEGIFLAAGPGIRAGASVEELSIVDVAPLLLHQLGLPAPEDMAGSVPEAIFEPGELERRPRAARPRGPPAALVASPAAERRAGARGAGGRDGAPARTGVRRVSRQGEQLMPKATLRERVADPLPAGRRRPRPGDGPRPHRQPRGLAPADRARAGRALPRAHLRPARPRPQRHAAVGLHARRDGRRPARRCSTRSRSSGR